MADDTKGKGRLTLKVSQKGAVSLYGLGRFPVTLYKEQWTRLLEASEEIRAFIRENEAKLKVKGAADAGGEGGGAAARTAETEEGGGA